MKHILRILVWLSIVIWPSVSFSVVSGDDFLENQKEDTLKIQAIQASAYELLLSNPEKSRELANRSFTLSQNIDFHRGVARSLSLLGSSYWAQGVYDKALNYYFRSLKKYEAMGFRKGVAHTYNNIGEVYKKQGDYEVSLRYLLKSLDILENELKGEVPPLTYNNLAELYYQIGQYGKASGYYSESLERAKSINDRKTMAYAYHGKGNIYHHRGELTLALGFYRQALGLRKEINDLRGMASSFHRLSALYTEMGMADDAKECLRNAEKAVHESGATDLKVENYQYWSKYYTMVQDYKMSLNFLQKYIQLKDSLFNQETAYQLANMRTLYEAASRERENRMLKINKEAQETKIKSQHVTIIAISLILLLVIVIAVILYSKNQEKLRIVAVLNDKNKEILDKSEEIAAQAEELHSLNEVLNEIKRRPGTLDKVYANAGKNVKFVYGVGDQGSSPQLNQPLATIKGLLNLIEYSELKETDSEIVTHLRESTHELESLITAMKKRRLNRYN